MILTDWVDGELLNSTVAVTVVVAVVVVVVVVVEATGTFVAIVSIVV
jgi:hypothetical protein